ncbi:MAG: hypothetical protein KR126chlam4_01208 [Candidatus Anoxychlamydiales bacterium]|nr:hypothetical protein [Candidatus Anoxychlamydiales bacterium]HEU64686.1 hypothetical protein [Chlamydiota bacterium]
MQEKAFDDEFLSEKLALEDAISKIEFELNSALEDFEKVSIDKLNEINDLINDMEDIAKIYHGQFLKDYIKFKMDFNFFVSTYEEIKRFKVETALEDFLDTLEILKKDLLE